MKSISDKINKIIERTKNGKLVWVLDDGFYVTKATDILSLELIDNTGFCENCCDVFYNVCCENPVQGGIILTGFWGVVPYDYSIHNDLLKELRDAVLSNHQEPKIDYEINKNITKSNLLDFFI